MFTTSFAQVFPLSGQSAKNLFCNNCYHSKSQPTPTLELTHVRFAMNLSETTQTLLDAKAEQGLSFADLEPILGQASASEDEAKKLLAALEVGLYLLPALMSSPVKGLGTVVPTDPLIYRFYEIMQVYGMPMKAVIHEKFGDGIMSAIDFTLEIEKIEDPKGDRVKVTMDGKFLPYKKW
jgi:cyanate lyase